MIRTDNPHLMAMEFETIKAPEAGEFSTTAVYGIEGRQGVYRRVAWQQAKQRTVGDLEAIGRGAQRIQLRRDVRLEEELREAGFVLPDLDENAPAT